MLISVLLPPEQGPRSARAISCASNIRQIGLALNLYARESKGFLPYGNVIYRTTWRHASSPGPTR
jgi:hypothetical protein